MQRARRLCALSVALIMVAVVSSGCASVHAAPIIQSLESHLRVIGPGDSVVIECVAVAEDGGELTYEWSADRGIINGSGPVIAWTAPEQEGIARITVSVSNGAGDPVTETVAVIVRKNVPPAIRGLTARDPWVFPGQSTTLHCEAVDYDDDELTYTWSADCGEITGEGAKVTWTAPGFETECTVTVVVDDGFGGQATATLPVESSLHEPLLVTEMQVIAVEDPNYLIEFRDRYKIFKGDSMIIRAVINEPDLITSYEWTHEWIDAGITSTAKFPVGTDRMVFESGPDQIRWISPRESGDHVITVTAWSEGGKSATRSIGVVVDTCPCSFPNRD